jgi:peroxiredoxin Q/BCP
MAKQSIKEGDLIPDFEAENHNGERMSFSAQNLVRPAVIYFYPKDDTPGCTAEACAFRDAFADFTDAGVDVIGISSDSVDKHKAFREKYRLPFTLLADTTHAIRKAFGVPTNLFGLLPGRVTYVVNQKGEVIMVFNAQLDATQHVPKALIAIEGLKY